MADEGQGVVVSRNLTKVFRDFWLREKVTAVAGLDLDIRPGEVFGLLGPNGSGKSTTIKMILGLLYPTRGRVAVFGRLPTDVRIKADIGFLPEESYLYPFLDARETLDFYGRLFRQPRRQRRRRVDMLLDMVGLGSVAYRRVGEYSKGMQRRIGLAQALINDPQLLILDEPTSGMDPIGTRQFKDLIRTLAMRGKTVILSSHLLADVEDVCDRICILYGGRQRALGRMDELLSKEDFTQITTERLDEAALESVRRVLAASGRELLQVSAPRDKLESLFLRIVQEAQEQRLSTGGAVSGGAIAEFLRGGEDQTRNILASLVSAAETQAPAGTPAVASSQAAATQRKTEVLRELVEPEKSTSPPQPQGDHKDAPPAGHPDRGLLDELLGGPKSDPEKS